MNVFLTGGTGFIGKPLTQALLRRGYQVTALVRNPQSREAQELQANGAVLLKGDLTQPDTLRPGMQGADIVINNAGVYSFGLTAEERLQMRAINVEGAENVFSLAQELKIARIVHVSSILAYGPTSDGKLEDERFIRESEPSSIYEATKSEAHQIARRYQQAGAPLVIACPAGVVGPGDYTTLGYYARLYVRGLCPPLLAAGKRSTVYVDDCAEAIVLVAEKGLPGEEYILSGGAISASAMHDVFKETPGGVRFKIILPRRLGEFGCRMLEPLQRMLGLPMIYSREVFTAGAVNWNYSGAKAVQELGAQFRDPRQAWLDTLAGERQRAQAGQSWRV
jgi:nucleoside-diphosphate-sugar epimerase